jgi:hypothetical protein
VYPKIFRERQIMQGVGSDDLVNVGQTARDGEPVRPVIAAEAHL